MADKLADTQTALSYIADREKYLHYPSRVIIYNQQQKIINVQGKTKQLI
jgi:hypothetical protein